MFRGRRMFDCHLLYITDNCFYQIASIEKRAGIAAGPWLSELQNQLEAEPCSELAGKCPRQQAARGVNEAYWLAEAALVGRHYQNRYRSWHG